MWLYSNWKEGTKLHCKVFQLSSDNFQSSIFFCINLTAKRQNLVLPEQHCIYPLCSVSMYLETSNGRQLLYMFCVY